jgi:hypothetical protein
MSANKTANQEHERFRAGSPAGLLAIVPVLLGFAPASSLVVIGTDTCTGNVIVTMRYDLPDPADDQIARDTAEHAIAVLRSQGLDTAVAVGYGPQALADPLARALLGTAAAEGVHIRELLRAHDCRYWSYLCVNQACCPADGRPFTPPQSPAECDPEGCISAALPSRAALAATIAPLGGSAADSMREQTRLANDALKLIVKAAATPQAARQAIAREGMAAVAAMIATYRAGGTFTTEYQLAWLSVVLDDLRVRDDAWARLVPGHNAAHRRMLIDLVRRAQPGHIAPAASLLAFVCWQAGNGALANLALDQAQADDPDYSMADSLRRVIASGAPPSMALPPMSPEQVAASYDDEHQSGGTGSA